MGTTSLKYIIYRYFIKEGAMEPASPEWVDSYDKAYRQMKDMITSKPNPNEYYTIFTNKRMLEQDTPWWGPKIGMRRFKSKGLIQDE